MHSLEIHKKELLRKFIEHSITEVERHELEELALDDPFLFEALEGYAVEGGKQTKSNLIEAVNSLGVQEEKKRKSGFRFTQLASIAAGLLFVAVMGFVIKQNIHDRENIVIQVVDAMEDDELSEEMAEVIEYEAEPNASLSYRDSLGAEPTDLNEKSEKRVEQLKVVPSSKIKLDKDYASKTIDKIKSPPPPVADYATIDGVRVDKNTLPVAEDEPEVIISAESRILSKGKPYQSTDQAPAPEVTKGAAIQNEESKEIMEGEYDRVGNIFNENRNVSAGKSKKKANSSTASRNQKNSSREISGQVVDGSGVPLIGANIVVPGTKIGTISDIDGNFGLDVPEDVTEIEIAYTGFSTQRAMINDASEYQFSMEESALLDEVVVVGYGSAGRNAEPVMGLQQFEDFIYENNTQDDCNESTTIIFDVTTTGAIKNIKVEDGNYDDCVNEAIRILIKSGAWRSIPPNRTVTTQYTFHFRR